MTPSNTMKYILLRVRVAAIVHGYDDANRQITESLEDSEWCQKLLSLDRLLSATERHLLVTGSHGRVMYWEYEGGLAWLTEAMAGAGLALRPTGAP